MEEKTEENFKEFMKDNYIFSVKMNEFFNEQFKNKSNFKSLELLREFAEMNIGNLRKHVDEKEMAFFQNLARNNTKTIKVKLNDVGK